MRIDRSAMAVTLAALVGCSTYDTLTPQVDVGTSGSISSSPLTEADMQTAMRQNEHGPIPPEDVPGGQMPRRQTYAQAYVSPPQPAPDLAESTTRGPQNTLEAQAEALQQGYNPAASQPLDTPVSDAPARQHRQSSHQHQPRSQPMAEPEPQPEQAATDPAPTTTGQAAPPTREAALPAADRNAIRFLPIIGAPEPVLTPLARQLAAEARAKGLTILLSADQPSQYVLKGYLSAYGEGSTVNIVYVWDVLDASGNRLHRIQGQQAIPGKAADPWAAVPASIMQLIATRTIEDYLDWRNHSRS